MMRRSSTIGLALVSAFLLTAGGHDRTILVDNFNEGNDANWFREDFTTVGKGGPGIYDASSGAYHIYSTGSVPINDPFAGAIDTNWIPSTDNLKFANGTLRGTIRADTDGSTVGFLLRANDEAFTFYGFHGSTSFGTFYIDRYNFPANPNAPQTIIAMAHPKRFPFVAGKTYHVEASVIGDRIRMKAWEVGHDPREAASLSVTDTVLGPNSGTVICCIVQIDPVPLKAKGVEAVQESGTFDNITFTPAGDDDHDDDDD
jgi:hypothetical protein